MNYIYVTNLESSKNKKEIYNNIILSWVELSWDMKGDPPVANGQNDGEDKVI